MQSNSSVEFSPFHLDLLNEQLWRGVQLLPLRPKPFAVLAYLATHAGRLVPHAELVKAVWPDTYVGEGLLRGYIREVRTVLGDNPEHPQFIETIPRRGYRFLPTVTTPPVSSNQFSVVSEKQGRGSESQLGTENWPLATRLVGREQELTQLHGWLAKALNGTRQVVFVLGEPGVGKTTVVDAFLHSLESAQVQGSTSKVQEDEERQNAKGKTQKAKVGDSSPAPSPCSHWPGAVY